MSKKRNLNQMMANAVFACWMRLITTKSDYARTEADTIAAAASEGFLTTRIGPEKYSRLWLPTPVGLEFLADTDPRVEF